MTTQSSRVPGIPRTPPSGWRGMAAYTTARNARARDHAARNGAQEGTDGPQTGVTVSFTLNGRDYTERTYRGANGAIYATTDRPRWGDGPCDVIVWHADGRVNRNIINLTVAGDQP